MSTAQVTPEVKPAKEKTTEFVGMWVEPSMKQLLKAVARAEDRSVSALGREALVHFLVRRGLGG